MNLRSPRSRKSSSRSPGLRVELQPSSALRLGLTAIAALLPIALASAPGAFHALRFALAAGVTALVWKPFREVVLARGSKAVASIELTGEGEWRVTDRAGITQLATLCRSSVTLGSWLLLRWKTHSGGPIWALVEPGRGPPEAFRTLKGRLNC